MIHLKHILLCSTLLASVQSTGVILWRDEFEGCELDMTSWSYDLGQGEWGWGNGELQTYTEESVKVKNGNLVITAERTGDTTFTSGRLKTTGKMTFQYAKVEARVMVPDVVEGLWPAIWTLGYNNEVCEWPATGEYDILEMGQGLGISEGVGNRRVVSAAHWVDSDGYTSRAGSYDSTYDLNGTYHIYTMDWTPHCVTTYVDGKQIWTMDISPSACQGCEELHHPHVLLINLAIGGGFTVSSPSSSSSSLSSCGGSSSSSSSSSAAGGCAQVRSPDEITAPIPAQMLVDYVRVIDNGYTIVDRPFYYSPDLEDTPTQTQEPPASDVAPTPTLPTPVLHAPVQDSIEDISLLAQRVLVMAVVVA